MSPILRNLSLDCAFVAAVAALTGCTAGEIVAADGTALSGYNGPSTVTFKSSSGQSYSVSTYQSGSEMVFSFDPNAPASSTNGPYIPAGKYTLDVDLCTDATHCVHYGNWTGFDLSYGQTCTDSLTNQSTPCALFKIVRCQFPADYQKYGTAVCQNATVSNGLTTVGVLDGP